MPRPYAAYVDEASRRFGLATEWIWAVMQVESMGNPRAVSPAGAIGLMQVMPATWAELTARYGLGADPFAARANILAGAAYLRAMLDRYGDLGAALAAYNAGPARVDAWRAGRRTLPAETILYVGRIAPGLSETPITIRASDAPVRSDWRAARLFSSRPEADPAKDVDARGGAAQAPQSASPATSPSSARPPNSGLFVAIGGRDS